MIKKYLFLIALISALFIGCEKEITGVIDPAPSAYSVKSLSSIFQYNYNQLDSLLQIRVEFTTYSSIQYVYCNIYAPDNKKVNSSNLFLFDNGSAVNGDQIAGDGKYSNKIAFSGSFLNGDYKIEYFVTDKSGSTKNIGQEKFLYDNGSANIAPVISNLVAPDTITLVTPSVLATFSVKADDANGLNDIKLVYLQSYRPDGTTSGNIFQLYDDGGLTVIPSSGDQVAGDGVYTLIVELPSSTTKGIWRFVFRARDLGNKLSNEISHNIVIR